MSWQPIETAPIGKVVEFGWYENDYQDGLMWRRNVGRVKRNWLTGRKYPSTRYCDDVTHWRALPEPPEQARNETD